MGPLKTPKFRGPGPFRFRDTGTSCPDLTGCISGTEPSWNSKLGVWGGTNGPSNTPKFEAQSRRGSGVIRVQSRTWWRPRVVTSSPCAIMTRGRRFSANISANTGPNFIKLIPFFSAQIDAYKEPIGGWWTEWTKSANGQNPTCNLSHCPRTHYLSNNQLSKNPLFVQ